MKNQTTKLLCLLTMVFSIFLSSCSDDDMIQTTDLVITVTDDNSTATANVSITLYPTEDDWVNETNVIEVQTTNMEGVATFIKLESKTYFIDATKSDFTNWGGIEKSSTLTANKINQLTISLSDSKGNFLVGKNEKSYQITDLRVGGVSLFSEYDLCEKDNTIFFQREESLGVEDLGNMSCVENEPIQRVFAWKFSADESMIFIDYEDGESIDYKVISMSHSKITLETNIPLDGQMVSAEVDFRDL